MQVGLSTLNEIGLNYTIRLNDKEVLVVEDDPVAKDRANSKELQAKQKQEEEQAKEAKDKNDPQELSEDEERLVNELAARDSEVRAHEAAHQAAGGGMTGAASYTYQQGPDGKMYAIGGEVSISMKSGSTPEETIANARQIAAAAMAASSPSPQDFSVASSARVMEMKAQQQLNKEKQNELTGQESYKNASEPSKQDTQQTPSLDIPA
jgi:NACalpha-BTF3-like transcription factor